MTTNTNVGLSWKMLYIKHFISVAGLIVLKIGLSLQANALEADSVHAGQAS